MITGLPVAFIAQAPASPLRWPAPQRPGPSATSAVRYHGRTNSRIARIAAIVVSAGLHAALLLGIGPPQSKVNVGLHEEKTAIIRLVIPEIKELEEPDPTPVANDAPPDPGVLVPMQADVPQLAHPSDFVQPLNFASLLDQPDFSKINVYAIPENIRSSGAKLAEQLGRIFNLADLDRAPEPVFQPAPLFPVPMRREAQSATVAIEFVVDSYGRVLDPVVFDSTHHGFDEAALVGVSRWKFRPGTKAGRKVSTRMRVPIVFTIAELID